MMGKQRSSPHGSQEAEKEGMQEGTGVTYILEGPIFSN
jgi:hypothetical protein